MSNRVLNGFRVLICISDPVNLVKRVDGYFSIPYTSGSTRLKNHIHDLRAFFCGSQNIHLDSFNEFSSILSSPVYLFLPLLQSVSPDIMQGEKTNVNFRKGSFYIFKLAHANDSFYFFHSS